MASRMTHFPWPAHQRYTISTLHKCAQAFTYKAQALPLARPAAAPTQVDSVRSSPAYQRGDVGEGLREAFFDMDARALACAEAHLAGATATVAVVRGDKLWVAGVGDSRWVVGGGGAGWTAGKVVLGGDDALGIGAVGGGVVVGRGGQGEAWVEGGRG